MKDDRKPRVQPIHRYLQLPGGGGGSTGSSAVVPTDIIRPVYNFVTTYGGKNDGTGDNSAALQAAVNAKQWVYFPPGDYNFNSPIVWPTLDETQSIKLFGAGITQSVLSFNGTGNAFVSSNNRTDHIVVEDMKIRCTNPANNGSCFLFDTPNAVQTRFTLERVAVWGFGKWGVYSLNMQSSLINNCHFRDNDFGHICFEDDDIGEFSREPNQNIISNNLLDNIFFAAGNVAVIRLYNSNGSLITGNTLQGHFIGGTGTKPAIFLEQCRAVTCMNNHVEAGTNANSAAYLIKDCRAITLIAPSGSGLHTEDIRLESSQGVTIIGARYQNDHPNVIANSGCRRIAIIGGIFSSPNNLVAGDSTPDGFKLSGTIVYHSQQSESYNMDIGLVAKDNRFSNRNLLRNGSFYRDLAGWGTATGMTRVATGTPPFDTPYVLCNTQGLSDGGQIGGTNFFQAITVPDVFPSGVYTLFFKFYIESKGVGSNGARFLDVGMSANGFSGSTAFRINNQEGRYSTGVWYTAKISDYLNAATGRTINININPTQGPDTPRVRFADMVLAQGTEYPRDQSLPDLRYTGWALPTGTSTRTTFDTATVTLSQLAERVKALLEDLTIM